VPFFEFFHNRVGAYVQDTSGIANATGIHRHIDDLSLDLRGLTGVCIVQQKSAAGTVLLSAAVPLLALPGLAMPDNISALTVGTVQDLHDHDATRSG
jgi:predicted glycosyltransferase